MKAIRRVALALLMLVVGVPLLAVAVLMAAPGLIRPWIQDAVEQTTGRAFAISGPISFSPGLHPVVTLGRFTLANAPDGSRPIMLTASGARAVVDIAGFLSGGPIVSLLSVDQPDLFLEELPDGSGNWQFHRPAKQPGPNVAAAAPRPRRALTDSIVADDLTVSVHMPFYSGRLTPPHWHGEIDMLDDRQFRRLFSKADAPLAHTLIVNRDDAGSYQVDGALRDSGNMLQVKGSIRDAGRLGGADLSVAAALSNHAALASELQIEVPKAPTLTLTTQITTQATGWRDGVSLQGLKAEFGGSDMSGNLSVKISKPISVTGTVSGSTLDTDALAALIPLLKVAPPSATPPSPDTAAASAAPPAAKREDPYDTKLDFAALRDIEADLDARFGKIVAKEISYTNVAVHPRIAAGKLTIDQATATVNGGEASLSLFVDAAAAPPHMVARFRAPVLPLGPILAAMRLPGGGEGIVGVIGTLDSTGDTPRALLISGELHVGIASEDATVGIMDSTIDEIARRSKMAEPPHVAGMTHIGCLAFRLNATHGQGVVPAVGIDTKGFSSVGSGEVDLLNETLNLHLRSTARLGPVGVSVPVTLSGPFRALHVEVVPSAHAIENTLTGMAGMVLGALTSDGRTQGAGGATCREILVEARRL
jgi:hypothetical protein